MENALVKWELEKFYSKEDHHNQDLAYKLGSIGLEDAKRFGKRGLYLIVSTLTFVLARSLHSQLLWKY